MTVPTIVGSGLSGTPAHAAPAEPDGLTPAGATVTGTPVLTWDRVPGATSYDVQVAADPDFAAIAYKVTTTNHQATPTVELPTGEIWWRVQANSSAGDSDWSGASYQRDELLGPALLSPQPGEELDQPEEPALLSWEPVGGAVSYTIEIDTSDDFITPKTLTTKTASIVVPDPQVATVYHWRVRAVLGGGVVTSFSDSRTYSIGGLEKPELTSPVDTALQSLEDVVLDWEPVVGAATYDVEISTDENFNTIDHDRAGVEGTRYSPPSTLDNDQYFWRVRPVDTLGNKLDWSAVDTWSFRRHWPDQPQLEYPDDGDVVGDPFYFQWAAVDKASHYVVEISESTDFSDPADSCSTVHTTYVPMEAGDCYPGAAGTYYWRVVAYDGSVNVRTDSIVSEVHTFSYLPAMVDLDSAVPADGSTVQVPTLQWKPVTGAAEYKVFVTAVDGGANSVNGVGTTSTTYTPRKALTPGKTYRWWVQTISADGRKGPGLTAGAQSTFTVAPLDAATGSVPDPLTPLTERHEGRFPGLTWVGVAGAAYYKVALRPAGSIQAFTELSDSFAYAAGDLTAGKAFGTYQWIVNAYDSSGAKIAVSSTVGVIQLVRLPDAGQPQAAMTGLGTAEGRTCTAVLPQRCVDLRQTPVLRWAPVENASGYVLYLSRDREMTNLVSGYPVKVDATMYMPRKALIDSQAGDAFYWEVQPCVTSTTCNPVTHAPWAFNKKSNPVELASPVNGATVDDDPTLADDITFTWHDYLATNQDQTDAAPVTDASDKATGDHARVEAREYRVEVSSVPNFQTLVDRIDVDQTTYTAFTASYPEGVLYWRVSAIDGSGNLLSSSPAWTFTKSSPTPTATAPIGDAAHAVSQTEPFRWDPMPFASRYDIEVYRNGDLIGQPVNKVFGGSSKQAAFTTTTPLTASATPYTWRLRRVDASGNPGAWTSFSSFVVSGTAPQLTAPGSTALVAGDSALFTWQKVAGATSYRFERRALGSTSTAEVVTTPGTAWAPYKTIADGSYEWRVSTIDAAGKVMASSTWRPFTVDATSPTTVRTGPIGTAATGSNVVARFSEPVIGISTMTFRLYRKGVPDPVPAVVRLDATGTKAVLDPKRNLRSGVTYTATLLPGITDKSGNALAPASWKFTVG